MSRKGFAKTKGEGWSLAWATKSRPDPIRVKGARA